MASRLLRLVAPVLAVALAGCTAVPQGGAVRKVSAPKNGVAVRDFPRQVASGPVKDASPQKIVSDLIVAMQSADPGVISEYLTQGYAGRWRQSWTTVTTVFSKVSAGPTQQPGATTLTAPVTLDLTLNGVIDSHGSWSRSGETARVAFSLLNVGGQWRVDKISRPGLLLRLDSLPLVLRPVHVYYPSREPTAPGVVPRLVPDTVYLKPDYAEGDLISLLVLTGPSAWISPGVYDPIPQGATFVSAQPPDGNGLAIFNFSGLAALKSGPPSALRTFEAQLAYTLAGSQYAGSVASIQIDNDGAAIDQPYSVRTLSDGYNPDLLSDQSPLYYVDASHHLVERDPLPDVVAGQTSATEQPPQVRLEHLDNVSRLALSPTLDIAGTATQLVAGVSRDQRTLELAILGDTALDPWHAVTIPGAVRLSTPTFAVTGNAVWVVAALTSGETRLFAVPLSGATPGTPVVVPVSTDVGVPALKQLTAAKLSRDGSRIALISGGVAYHNGTAYVGVVEQLPAGGWQVVRARSVMDPIEHVSQIDVAWQDRFTLGVVTQRRTESTSAPKVTSLVTVQADGTPNGTADVASADPLIVDRTPASAVQFAGAPSKPWVSAVGNTIYEQPSPSDQTHVSVEQDWQPLDAGSSPLYAD